jgi:hypothetical protein
VERTLSVDGTVTSFKVKTRENVIVSEVPRSQAAAAAPGPVQRVQPLGPVSEPRTYMPYDPLPGIIQLQAPPP